MNWVVFSVGWEWSPQHQRESPWPLLCQPHVHPPLVSFSQPCGRQQDSPARPHRATFSFRAGREITWKVVRSSEIIRREELDVLQFSHLENTVGARAAISSTVWFIHITINGLFLQEVCCNGRGSSREPGSGALPALPCHPWQLCSRQGLLQLPSPSPRSTWPTALQTPGEQKCCLT